MYALMAGSKKEIQMIFFLMLSVSLLFVAFNYYASQRDTGISFDFYQPRGYGRIWEVTGQTDSENRGQNLSAESGVDGDAKKCTKQVFYWLGPRMKLPDGEYVCPGENLTVRFKSGRGYGALNTSDVVILHQTGNWTIKELMRHRPKGQMWVYMSWESPPHSIHGRVPNVFNWTMTYRTDSEFSLGSPYGSYKEYDRATKERNLVKNKNKNWAENKTKLAAWMASKCGMGFYLDWPRTRFVQGLRKKLAIDTFGRCGDQSCPRGNKGCLEQLRSYKFYLAFENSCCKDYITEKTWTNSFLYDTVPIVYGTSKRNYEKLAPPNSFIHVSDFPNMTSLANYIKVLNRNDSLYNNFFKWKDFGYIDLRGEDQLITKVKLCSMAETLCSVNQKPITVDINKRWFDTCIDPPPLPQPV